MIVNAVLNYFMDGVIRFYILIPVVNRCRVSMASLIYARNHCNYHGTFHNYRSISISIVIYYSFAYYNTMKDSMQLH